MRTVRNPLSNALKNAVSERLTRELSALKGESGWRLNPMPRLAMSLSSSRRLPNAPAAGCWSSGLMAVMRFGIFFSAPPPSSFSGICTCLPLWFVVKA